MSVQIICGTKNSNASGGTNPVTVLLTGTQEHQSTTRAQLMPIAGTFRNFRVRIPTALGVGNGRTYTIRKNGVATALAVTFGAADTEMSITGTDVHFAVDDPIDLNITFTGANVTRLHQTTIEFEPDTDGQVLYGFHGQDGGNGKGCCPFMGERFYTLGGAPGGTDFNARQVNRIDQDIVAMSLRATSAPGAGTSIYAVWVKNGVDQDGTAGTPNTKLTLSDTNTDVPTVTYGTPLHLNVGDVVTVALRTGSGAPFYPDRWSFAFAAEPTNTGEYTAHGQGLALGLANAGSSQFMLAGGGDWIDYAWGSTESDVYAIGNPVSDITFVGMYVDLSAALDAATEGLTFHVRVNGGDDGDPVVIAGVGAQNGTITFSSPVTIAPGDFWNVRGENTGSASIDTGALKVRTVLLPGFMAVPDPIVQTRPATAIRFDSATLRGRINPAARDMIVWFEWGLSPGSLVNDTADQNISAGTSFISFSQGLTGLTRATTYYFRAVGRDGGSPFFFGEILSFTTLDEHVFVDGDVSHPLTYAGFTDRDGDTHVFAEVDLNDARDYEHGYKAPWVLQWLPITRGFSDRTGQIEHMVFGGLLSDTSRFFRGMLDHVTNRFLTNRPLWEKMIDDESRRVEGLWRYVANGYISDYEPRSPLQMQITGCDWLKRKFNRKARTQSNWQPLITVDKFPECKEFNLNKAVPIVYGRMDDTRIESTQIGTTSPYDGTIRPVSTAFAMDEPSGPFYGPVTVIVVPVVSGSEGPISNGAGTVATDRTINAYWNHQGTADSYAIYFHDGGWLDWTPHGGVRDGATVTFVRRLTHDNSTIDGAAGLRDFVVSLTSLSDGTNALTGVATALVDKGHGTHKPLYVGTVEPFTDGPVYVAVVSRGAVHSIRELYVDGIAQNIATDASQAGVGGIWYIPGYPNWNAELPDPYIDIGGARYTVIYGKVGFPGPDKMAGLTVPEVTPGTRPANVAVGVTLNVWGVEDLGDGDGELITSLPQQQKHFMRNFLAGNEPPGTDWRVTCPTFEHEPTLDMVDESSFDAVEAIWEEVHDTSPAGIEGAFVIGANGAIENAIDVLARFHVSGDWNGTFTRKGQYAISMEPATTPDDPVEIDDIVNITDGSFSIRDLVSTEFYNVLPYLHTEDYTGITESGWHSTEAGERDVRDATSITNYEQERESPPFELAMLRANITGDDVIGFVMARKLARYKHPLRTASCTVPLSGTQIEVGDIFEMSHIEGIGATGWQGRLVRCTRHELDPNMNRVRLEVYDVEPLL